MSIIGLIRDWLVDPIGLLFLLSLIFLAVLAYKRVNLCLILCSFVWIAAVGFVSAPVIVNPMLVYFENQFEEEPVCLATRPIVLLGGGVDSRVERAEDVQLMDHATFVRSVAVSKLAQRFPDAPLLLSGGGAGEVSEAAVIGHYLRNAGVDSRRIYEETRSKNTHENAINISALIDDREFDERIILVTSALHMKRAKAVFEKQGLDVCPVAVDRHGVEGLPLHAAWPQISAMNKFDLLMHEVVALLVYKTMGRI